MNKRETTLDVILIKYAIHGHTTMQAAQTYAKSSISLEAYKEAIVAGMKVYNTRQKEVKV